MPATRREDVDDSVLVAAIGNGDGAAMAEIVRRHREPVVAFARRIVGGDHDRAEEISQDVFVRLGEQSDRFDPQRGALRTFLLALTHGRAVDVVRSDVARRRREERDAARTTDFAHEVGERILARTVGDAVRHALSQIPESERRAIELAYLGGHSYRAVASMLGEPEGTVKSRIRSGLARLRRALADQDFQYA